MTADQTDLVHAVNNVRTALLFYNKTETASFEEKIAVKTDHIDYLIKEYHNLFEIAEIYLQTGFEEQ